MKKFIIELYFDDLSFWFSQSFFEMGRFLIGIKGGENALRNSCLWNHLGFFNNPVKNRTNDVGF